MEEKRITSDIVSKILCERRAVDTDKRDYGTLLIFAGKDGMAGAAILAAKAALRSGVGLVKVATPKTNFPMLQIAVPEAICIEEDEAVELLKRQAYEASYDGMRNSFGVSALAVGPGMGMSERTNRILKEVVLFGKKNPDIPILIDADGLNAVSASASLQQEIRECNLVITPHKREAARLVEEAGSRMETVLALQSKYKGVSLLKGYETLITNGDILWINTTGNPGMATAGSGDVLTGIIGSLLAQGISPLEATCAGAFVHGRAGDLAAETLGERSLMAGDIIERLPKSFMDIND